MRRYGNTEANTRNILFRYLKVNPFEVNEHVKIIRKSDFEKLGEMIKESLIIQDMPDQV